MLRTFFQSFRARETWFFTDKTRFFLLQQARILAADKYRFPQGCSAFQSGHFPFMAGSCGQIRGRSENIYRSVCLIVLLSGLLQKIRKGFPLVPVSSVRQ